jgi:hypothetical protein
MGCSFSGVIIEESRVVNLRRDDMKTLLVFLLAACFCLVPVAALFGNTAPTLYLEIYGYDVDPDDPDVGCIAAGTCPELCYHIAVPQVGEIQCYIPKVNFQIAAIPIHVAKLDTPPLAPGWPLPCGPGGGWVTISCGITRTGATATVLGLSVCPVFLQGPGTVPAAILYTATTQCHDWYDHGAYMKYMNTTSTAASYFDITTNADDGILLLKNCQAIDEIPPQLLVGGRAQWGGTKSVTCAAGETGIDLTTWGKIKGLYR